MHALENVIWQALNTRQANFAEANASACRFIPEVSPLAGFREDSPAGYEALRELLPPHATAALFLASPYAEATGWQTIATAPLLQMVFQNGLPRGGAPGSSEFVQLGDNDSPEMIELTALTKPGPFNGRTHELGSFLGIRREGRLAAMAGERLKVPGYTEVSAVCTHPDYLGRGYAGMLMTEVMRRIRERGETPFLHVREDNERAIALYRRLGFESRARVHLAVLRKT